METNDHRHLTHGNYEQIEVDKLKEYEKNPKKHGPKEIESMCDAIKEVGWTVPVIIDQHDRLVAGHKRKKAAIKLGRRKVPFIRVELTEAEYHRELLKDNKMSAVSKLNKKLEREVMEILQGLNAAIDDIPGYDAEEIDKIFGLSTKETIDGTGDFGDAGEVDGEIDPDARVVSMTFKLPAKNHKKIKDVLTAIQRENDLETLSEALIYCMGSFKGTTKTIRR